MKREMEGQMDGLRRENRSLENYVAERDAEIKKKNYELDKTNAALRKAQDHVQDLQQTNSAFKERIEELQAADDSRSARQLTNPSTPPASFNSIAEGDENEDGDGSSSSTDPTTKAAEEFAKNAKGLVKDSAAKKAAKNKQKSPLLKRNLSRDSTLTNRDRAAVEIQRISRGWLARVMIGHLMTEKAAAHQGILVAYRGSGTRQGEAGWYISNQQLFYFALDKGEFVLVCGPVSEKEYDQALNECLNKGIPPRPSSIGEIEIDRLGLVAVRIEIGRYKRRIEVMENALGPNGALEGKIDGLKRQIECKEQEIICLQRVVEEKNMDIQRQKGLVEKQERVARDARQAMNNTKLELITLEDRMRLMQSGGGGGGGGGPSTALISSSVKAAADGSTDSSPNSSHMQFMAHRGGMSAAEISARFASLDITTATTMRIVRLQAYVRGFIKRSKDKTIKNFSQASASGVLVAMKGTVQGRSGWYRAPDDRVYYFTLSREDWIMTAGPLSVKTYQNLIYGPLPLSGIHDPSSRRLIDGGSGTGTPKVSKSKGRSLAAGKRTSLIKRKKHAAEAYQAGNLLAKANCEMQVVYPDLTGELFVDRSTKHLFFAVNLEQMVKSSFVSR